MKHDRQIAMLNMLVDLRERQQYQFMNNEILHLPLDIYSCQNIFEREIETLFSDYPLVSGHGDSVRRPGSYMLSDWKRQPYIVVRGHDGILRAFMNICRHRGAPLIDTETDKSLHSFVCRYHGWTYGLDGTLQEIPREFAFPCLEKKDHGLKEIPVKESMGLVWVHPKSHGPFDPVDYLGTFAEDVANFELGRYVRHKKITTEKKANWKLLISFNLEAYHVPTLHKYTFEKGFRRGVLTYDTDGPHLRVLGGRANLMESMDVPEKDRNILDYATVFYVMFPNTILFVHTEYISMCKFFPVASDRTIWTHEFLYRPECFTGEAGQKSLKNLFVYINDVVYDSEDYTMAEKVQENLLNGVNENHMLGLEEGLIMVFQDIVSNRTTAAA